MTDQHVVEFDGVRLTRLPPGRAEGSLWLMFTGKGEALRFTRSPEDWGVRDHVAVAWPSGAKTAIQGGGGWGADGFSSFLMAVHDTGESSAVLTYVGAESIIDQEDVPIPTTQHTVELEGVRLTRLPAGRAEGFVWLMFVGAGDALRYTLDRAPDWRIRSHVSVAWPDGRPADIVESGSGGGDGTSHFAMTIRDTGGVSLVLTYVDINSATSEEVVSIPA
jgi:hypothetical protein